MISGHRVIGNPSRVIAVSGLMAMALMVACGDEVSTPISRQVTSSVALGSAGGKVPGNATSPTSRPGFGPAIDPVLQPRVGASVQFGEEVSSVRVTVSARTSWQGKSPESYFESRRSDDHVVLLVPVNPLDSPRFEQVDALGDVFFPEVPPGQYHLVYKVNFNVFGTGQPKSILLAFPRLDLHDHAANVIGYWCRPVIVLNGDAAMPRDSFDLFWDNGALPRTPAGVTPAVLDEDTIFRASVKQFTFRPLVSGSKNFSYSIIIADPFDPSRTLWVSPWQTAENGLVKISWNGFVAVPGKNSGILRRVINPDEAGASRLPAGKYLYAIQFRELLGKGTGSGPGFPEMLGLFAPAVGGVPQDDGIRQGEAFQMVEFGQTLFCPFTLDPAPLATASASPSSSP